MRHYTFSQFTMTIPNQTTVWMMTVRKQNNGLERRGQPHNGERLHSETGGPGVTKTVSQRKANSFAGLTQVHHASSPEREGRGSRRLEVCRVSLDAFRRSFVSLAHGAVDWLGLSRLAGRKIIRTPVFGNVSQVHLHNPCAC
jgi:hypothetical protein